MENRVPMSDIRDRQTLRWFTEMFQMMDKYMINQSNRKGSNLYSWTFDNVIFFILLRIGMFIIVKVLNDDCIYIE